jgi:hypothetical protein
VYKYILETKTRANKSITALFDDLMPPAERRYFSIGACCQTMDITPGQLKVVMDEVGLRFDRCIDAVPYVDGRQYEAIFAKCIELRESISTKMEAAKSAAPNN